MPEPLIEKRYKVTFEFKISMSEVDEKFEFPEQTLAYFTRLKRLQEALLQDEEALTKDFISTIFSELEGGNFMKWNWSNTPESVKAVIMALEPEDAAFFLHAEQEGYLLDEVSPVTCDSVTASVDSCEIFEIVETESDQALLKPVWQYNEST